MKTYSQSNKWTGKKINTSIKEPIGRFPAYLRPNMLDIEKPIHPKRKHIIHVKMISWYSAILQKGPKPWEVWGCLGGSQAWR